MSLKFWDDYLPFFLILIFVVGMIWLAIAGK